MKKNLIFKIFVILIIAFNFTYGMGPQSNGGERMTKQLAAREATVKRASEESKIKGQINHQIPLKKQPTLLQITLKKRPLTNQDREEFLAYTKIQRQAAKQKDNPTGIFDNKLKNYYYELLINKEKQEITSRLKEDDLRLEEKGRIEEERMRFSINLIQTYSALKNLMNYLDGYNIYYTNYATNISLGDQSFNVIAIIEECVQAIKDANTAINSNIFDTSFNDSLLSSIRNNISNIKIFISFYLKEEDQRNALNFILSAFPDVNWRLFSTDLLIRLQSINNSLENTINAYSDINLSSLGRVKGLKKRALEAIFIIKNMGEAMKNPVLARESRTTQLNLNKLALKELEKRYNIVKNNALTDNNKIEEVGLKAHSCSTPVKHHWDFWNNESIKKAHSCSTPVKHHWYLWDNESIKKANSYCIDETDDYDSWAPDKK